MKNPSLLREWWFSIVLKSAVKIATIFIHMGTVIWYFPTKILKKKINRWANRLACTDNITHCMTKTAKIWEKYGPKLVSSHRNLVVPILTEKFWAWRYCVWTIAGVFTFELCVLFLWFLCQNSSSGFSPWFAESAKYFQVLNWASKKISGLDPSTCLPPKNNQHSLSHRNSDSVLSDKDCENVYELVYSSHRQVAQAAGEFLNTKLFQRDDEATKHLKTAKGKKRSPNTPLIRDLVQFFIESEVGRMMIVGCL